MSGRDSLEFPEAAVLLFAREPVEGQVKTRLEPVLGRVSTLRLHERLIRHAAITLERSGLCDWQFWVAGNEQHPLFRETGRGASGIYRQQGEDLGERMQSAAAAALSRYRHVVLLGADCASVDASYLRGALQRLQDGDEVVIGPAEDGGYVLLGLRKADVPLFDAMPWGTPGVLDTTRRRLADTSLCWSELDLRWDVDRPADLQRLATLPGWPESA